MLTTVNLTKARRPAYVPNEQVASGDMYRWLCREGYYRRQEGPTCKTCHANPVSKPGLRCPDCRERFRQYSLKRPRKKCKWPGCKVRLTPSSRKRGYTGYCRKHYGPARTRRLKARKNGTH